MTNQMLPILIIALFFNVSAFSQSEFKMLSPKKMAKDLKIVLETMDAHPNPYIKISEEDYLTIVKRVEKNLSVELDEIDFYKNISMIVASLKDGHSSVNMPTSWLKQRRKENGAFPYEVFLTNENELYVLKSYDDNQLPLGSQIIEINGISVEEFIEKISPYVSYETIAFRNDRITESFELMLYLAFKKVDQLSFKYRVAEEFEVTITTIPYKEFIKQKKDLREERDSKLARGELYDFNIIKPGVAEIDIFSFQVEQIDKYRIFLENTFKKIEKNGIHSLIIDVRGNYGGWPKVASELFHYIHEGHFKTMANSNMKISSPFRKHYTYKYPTLNSEPILSQGGYYQNMREIVRGKLNSYLYEDMIFNEAPITKRFEFKGDCYALIDRKSYSASTCFASTFQCYSMGSLVGEPTGGTKIFRGNPFPKVLPNSNLIVIMATTRLSTACSYEEDVTVLPDVEVIPTIMDRVSNVDSQLNAVLILIEKNKSQKASNTDRPK